MKDYANMSQEDLIKTIEDQEQLILDLQVKFEQSKNKFGRKEQVLELLKKSNSISIIEIAEKLDINTKNVSSQLTYLRADGYKIMTDHKGRKVLDWVEESE